MNQQVNIIPIALASDDNYAMPMAVAMTSILLNANKNTYYDFYLLLPSDFSEYNKDRIKYLENKYPCRINFIDMKGKCKNFPNKLAHATIQTYYRLFLDRIIKEYSKIIYLDVDILVKTDLSDLYAIDLEDYYYAGVIHPTYYFGNWKNHYDLLGIPNLKKYINAGVLLINLQKIRHDGITDTLVETVQKDFPTVDQDVINSVCYGKIKSLPFKYNVLIKTVDFLKTSVISELYDYDEFYEAFQNPAIIHFANPTKPWNDASLIFADEWFRYFQQSPYSDTELGVSKIFLCQPKPTPLVSVVISTYNRAEYIEEAINSILSQTLRDFELIIVDDGSTDQTALLLKYYQVIDKRIKVFTNTVNKGISYSRNLAHRSAVGKYIAVMDDDDISLPRRLEMEADYLERHPNIAVVASNIDVFICGSPQDNNSSFFKTSWSQTMPVEMLSIMMMTRNYICHSSALIRKDFIDTNNICYNENLNCAVDYDLWSQILLAGGKIYILENILQRYRVHSKCITTTIRKIQDKNVELIQLNLLNRLFGVPIDAQSYFSAAYKKLNETEKIDLIKTLNNKKKIFESKNIDKCLALSSGLPYPTFDKNLIPIVFAADDNYVPYLAVAMQSIISNASKDYNYEFIVLETAISKIAKEKILSHFSAISNLKIKFINLKKMLKEYKFYCPSYYSEATYYRLFIEKIFHTYEKLIYLDVDIVVLRDISELFQVDVEGHLLAASLNAGSYPAACFNWEIRGVKWRDYLLTKLKIKNIENYFQAGVLVINVNELKKFGLQAKALKKLEEINPVLVDQDILNFVCEGRVKKLSLQWDFLDSFREDFNTAHWVNFLLPEDRVDYLAASQDPYIVHYASSWSRAWEKPHLRYADLWWHYARMTPFYEEIIFKNIHNKYKQAAFSAKSDSAAKASKLQYYRYKILSKITFGNRRKHYKRKRQEVKQLLRANK